MLHTVCQTGMKCGPQNTYNGSALPFGLTLSSCLRLDANYTCNWTCPPLTLPDLQPVFLLQEKALVRTSRTKFCLWLPVWMHRASVSSSKNKNKNKTIQTQNQNKQTNKQGDYAQHNPKPKPNQINKQNMETMPSITPNQNKQTNKTWRLYPA